MNKLQALCLLIFAMPAFAQDSPPVNAKGETWKIVYSLIDELMNEEIASKMSMIAYHEVAQEICDGVHTDPAKIKAAVLDMRPINYAELTEDDRHLWNKTALANYGMVFGVMLDQNIEDRDAFCTNVRATIADKDNDWHYFDTEPVRDE